MTPDSLEPGRQRRAWRVLSAMALLLAAASILLTAKLWTRTNDAITQTRIAVAQVQRSRLEICRQNNERHDGVIHQFNLEVAQLHGAERARADRSRRSTIRLLNAIAPKHSCRVLLTPPSPRRPDG